MKIEIDVDTENNEGTHAPYWLIIDPVNGRVAQETRNGG